jgi:hypothetical protein
VKKAKTTSVAKPARPARQAAPSRQKLQQEVSTLQSQVRSLKHKQAPSAKHHPAKAAAKGKHSGSAKHGTKRGLALSPGDVACCAAQALAGSLRLALGEVVADEDVLALYWRTAAGPDEGASILATLEAVREYGISGVRPVAFAPVSAGALARACPEGDCQAAGSGEYPAPRGHAASIILGLCLPEGPHAVAAAGGGFWWSWGEPYDPASFPGTVIEECWAVTW